MDPDLLILLVAAALVVLALVWRLRETGPRGVDGGRSQRGKARKRHAFMKTPEAWAGRAELLLDRKRPDLARRLLDDAQEQFPEEPRLKRLRRRAEEADADRKD